MQVTGNSDLKFRRSRYCHMFKGLSVDLAAKVCGRRSIMLNLLDKLISILFVPLTEKQDLWLC
jgi:hypothetical protein